MMVLEKERMIECWQNRQLAIKAKPYCGDRVQAWGLAFAPLWNLNKEYICKKYNIEQEDFCYALSGPIMKRIIDER